MIKILARIETENLVINEWTNNWRHIHSINTFVVAYEKRWHDNKFLAYFILHQIILFT